jgi:hypothetical protein
LMSGRLEKHSMRQSSITTLTSESKGRDYDAPEYHGYFVTYT